MGKKTSKQLYKTFLDQYEVASKNVTMYVDDPVHVTGDIAELCYAAGEYVGYNEGLWTGFKCMVKGAVGGVIVALVVDRLIAKAIDEEGGPVKYGPFTFYKKED